MQIAQTMLDLKRDAEESGTASVEKAGSLLQQVHLLLKGHNDLTAAFNQNSHAFIQSRR